MQEILAGQDGSISEDLKEKILGVLEHIVKANENQLSILNGENALVNIGFGSLSMRREIDQLLLIEELRFRKDPEISLLLRQIYSQTPLFGYDSELIINNVARIREIVG